jgi:hypothetical protein
LVGEPFYLPEMGAIRVKSIYMFNPISLR